MAEHNAKPRSEGMRCDFMCDCGFSTGLLPRFEALSLIEGHLRTANKRK